MSPTNDQAAPAADRFPPRHAAAAALLAAALPAAAAVAQTVPPARPTAGYWTPVDRPGFGGPVANGTGLLDYSLAGDPDAVFNRGGTALSARAFAPALQANPHAKSDQGRVMSLAAFAPTSGNPSQGMWGSNAYYAFSDWQYLDTMVFFGGSASEGNILAPNTGVIDAAHRNGVKVYGTLFFPPNAFGGEIGRVDDLTRQRPDGSFPLADKLIEVARTQGFDGYFINQETNSQIPGERASERRARADRISRFMGYVQANSDVELSWYDAFTEDGFVSGQRELNSRNDSFVQRDGKVVSQNIFVDFGASAADARSSGRAAEALGRSRYDVFTGVDFQQGLFNSESFGGVERATDAAFGPARQNVDHVSSYGIHRPDHVDASPERFFATERTVWTGAAGDPTNTAAGVGGQDWHGVANYVAAKTPLVRDTFVSNFNLGIGKAYYVDGQVNRAESWNNIGLQDVLPTWRFWFESDGPKLSADLDFDDAYLGGSSLRVSGELQSRNDLNLYMADIPVSADSKLQLAFKTGSVGGTALQALIRFKGDEDNPVSIPAGDAASAGWNLANLDLSAYAGRTIAGISLRFDGIGDPDYAINIGRVGVLRGEADVLAAPTAGRIQRFDYAPQSGTEPTRADVRLLWDHSADHARTADGDVYYYNVYQIGADGERRFLGGGGTNAYFAQDVLRVGDENQTTLEVVTVSREFGVSSAERVSLFWPLAGNRVANFDLEAGDPAAAGKPLLWQSDRLDANLGDGSGTETSGTFAAWTDARANSGGRSLMLAADGDDGGVSWELPFSPIDGGEKSARWWMDYDLVDGVLEAVFSYYDLDSPDATLLGSDLFTFDGSSSADVEAFLMQQVLLDVPAEARFVGVEFRLNDSAQGTAFVDDVSIGRAVAVPEPSGALALLGTSLLLRRRRRR